MTEHNKRKGIVAKLKAAAARLFNERNRQENLTKRQQHIANVRAQQAQGMEWSRTRRTVSDGRLKKAGSK